MKVGGWQALSVLFTRVLSFPFYVDHKFLFVLPQVTVCFSQIHIFQFSDFEPSFYLSIMSSNGLLEVKESFSIDDSDVDSSPLPSPVSAAIPRPQKTKLSAATIIPIWIVLSSAVIIYNNYLYNTLKFKYPVFLVTWHLAFAVSGAFLPLGLGP